MAAWSDLGKHNPGCTCSRFGCPERTRVGRARLANTGRGIPPQHCRDSRNADVMFLGRLVYFVPTHRDFR